MDNWMDIRSAPSLERVIVCGWQPPHGSTIGYWWYHEDETDENGVPIDHPTALLWQRFPAVPDWTPPARAALSRATEREAG